MHEVSRITGNLRNNTAPGEGSITAELVEGGVEAGSCGKIPI